MYRARGLERLSSAVAPDKGAHVEEEHRERGVEVRAAGGVVWKETSEGLRLAVIHRRRYGDWTLPKGKLKPGEGWREAALREVKEETGCVVDWGAFAGCVTYPLAEGTKVVRFWNMRARTPCKFDASEEVDRVEWLSVAQARQRLDYPGERAVVEANADEQVWQG